MADAQPGAMERMMNWLGRHQAFERVAWLAALFILAGCNNGTDGGGPGGY